MASWPTALRAARRRAWEVRSALGGNRIARVIFCMGDGHMILLHGFLKKTQKTPKVDIDLALKRMKEVT
jgi:phage-related protein